MVIGFAKCFLLTPSRSMHICIFARFQYFPLQFFSKKGTTVDKQRFRSSLSFCAADLARLFVTVKWGNPCILASVHKCVTHVYWQITCQWFAKDEQQILDAWRHQGKSQLKSSRTKSVDRYKNLNEAPYTSKMSSPWDNLRSKKRGKRKSCPQGGVR